MMDDEKLYKIAKDRYRLSRDHRGTWRQRNRTCYDFYAGRQWDEQTKMELEATGRAPVVMNRIKPRVEAVVGMEVSNRQEIRFSPRENASTALVDLQNRAGKWTRDQAETEDQETHAFRDCLITGEGWTETVMSYEDNLDGVAITVRRSPMQYDPDPDSSQPNYVDAKYLFYSEDVDPTDAEALFPGQRDKLSSSALGVMSLWDESKRPDSDTNEAQYPDPAPTFQQNDGPAKKVRIVRYQYSDLEPIWRVMAPDGSMRRVKPAEAEALKESMATEGTPVRFEEFDETQLAPQRDPDGTLVLPYVKQNERRYYQAWFSGANVLEHRENPMPHGFTDNCTTGWRDETEGYWFGMVEGLIDPQEWSNKFLSQAIYIYTVNPKGGVIAERTAIKDLATFKNDYSSPDSVVMVEDGALSNGRIIERKPGAYPSDLDKLTAFAIDALPALDGLNPEVLGTAGRDQPGLLEKMRKQAGMTILAPLFDSLRRYRKRQGKVTLHYISQYFTEGQLQRITKAPIDPTVLKELRSQDARDYDVIVDDAPSSPNMKEYVLNVLMEIIRQAPQVAAALAPMMVKYSPLPLEAQQEIMSTLSALNSPQNSPQFLALQQSAQKLQQENQQLKSNLQVKMAQTQVKAQTEAAKHDLKQKQAQADTILTVQQMRAEFEIERERLRQDMQIAMTEMLGKLGLKREEIHLNHAAKLEAARQGGTNGIA